MKTAVGSWQSAFGISGEAADFVSRGWSVAKPPEDSPNPNADENYASLENGSTPSPQHPSANGLARIPPDRIQHLSINTAPRISSSKIALIATSNTSHALVKSTSRSPCKMNDWERVGNDRPGVPLDSLGLASAPPQAIQIRGYAANHANGIWQLAVGSWH